MKLKIALVTAILMAPSVSLAMGCSGSQHKQAMSCAEGTAYDAETGTCVAASA